MVNSKKMSKSSIAVIVLSILLVLSMVLGLTGAWFTSSDNATDDDSFNFGTVKIENAEATITRNECLQTLVVDHCNWKVTAAYENASDVGILYTVAYSVELYKDDVKVEDSTVLGYFSGIATKQEASLKYAAANAVADTIDDFTITFDSENAMNGEAGNYKMVVNIEIKAMQADHATPDAVLSELGLTVTAQDITDAIGA